MPEMAQIAVEVGVLGLVVPSCKKHHLLQYRGTRQLGRNHHHHHGCVVYNACYARKRIAVVCSQQQKGPANTKNNATAATKVAEKAILEERSIPAAGPLSRQPLQQEVMEEGGRRGGVGSYPAWARPLEGVLQHFQVDMSSGLTASAVEMQRTTFGWNELEKGKKKPFWELVTEQFDDALVQILLVAAAVSFVLALSDVNKMSEVGIEAFTEPLIISAIVLLNAVIGVWQESKAESTLKALKEMQSEAARVLREGIQIMDLPARELVPGDIVELRAGDKVAADMRVAALKSGTVRLQQASLTGESEPVLKQIQEGSDEDIELQGKECMVFAGTTVTNGTCVCVVTETGMATEIGKIQAQIQDAAKEDYDTPLTQKLDEFANLLTKVVGTICVLVWLVNYRYFISWDVEDGFPANFQFNFEQATYYFKVAVALAVAAIPEGLPAVITTCLALGTRRMAEENAIVRKLPSVETLGCTSVICSDKTGTLTTNQQSVVRLVGVQAPEELRTFVVSGTSYDPRDGEVVGLPDVLDMNLQSIAQVCALCNDAGIQYKSGGFSAVGMPTEAAMKVLVEKLRVPDTKVQEEIDARRSVDLEKAALGACQYWGQRSKCLFTLEFDRVRKSMSVIVKEVDGQRSNKLLVKVHS